MREQFEKLPEIAEIIKSGDVWWSEEHGNYISSTFESSCYISGARYAFQEQQKRIDVLEKFIRLTCYIDEEGVKNCYVECTELTYVSKLSSDDADIIKELLK